MEILILAMVWGLFMFGVEEFYHECFPKKDV